MKLDSLISILADRLESHGDQPITTRDLLTILRKAKYKSQKKKELYKQTLEEREKLIDEANMDGHFSHHEE